MLTFLKVSQFKFITLVLSILFLFDSALYACPFSKNILRVKSSFNNPEYEGRMPEALRMAEESNRVLASNAGVVFYQQPISRRGLFKMATAPVTASLIPIAASAVPAYGLVKPPKSNGSVLVEVSNEGIVWRVFGVLNVIIKAEQVKKAQIGEGKTLFRIDENIFNSVITTVSIDFTKRDIDRANQYFKEMVKKCREQTRRDPFSTLENLQALSDFIRAEYQKVVDQRRISEKDWPKDIRVFGETFNVLAIEEAGTFSSYHSPSIVYTVEPSKVFSRIWFSGLAITDKTSDVAHVFYNIQKVRSFIDEVLVPALNNKQILAFTENQGPLTNRETHDAIRSIIGTSCEGYERGDMVGEFKQAVLTHEERHSEKNLREIINIDKVEAEIRKYFSIEDSRKFGFNDFREFAVKVSQEMDAYLWQLGEGRNVSPLLSLTVIAKVFNEIFGGQYDISQDKAVSIQAAYATHIGMALVLKSLCQGEDLLTPFKSFSKNKTPDMPLAGLNGFYRGIARLKTKKAMQDFVYGEVAAICREYYIPNPNHVPPSPQPSAVTVVGSSAAVTMRCL